MHSSVAHLPRGNRPRNPRIRVVSGRQALAFNYQYLNRLQEAANTLQQATARKLEIGDYLVERYDLSFLEADQAGMQREAALAHGKSGQENGSQAMKRLSGYSGRLQPARRLSHHAADLAQQAGQRDTLLASG